MPRLSLEKAIEKIESTFPNQPYEIIDYQASSFPFTIKCKKCEETKTYSSYSNFINSGRKGLCPCYNLDNSHTRHNLNKERIQSFFKDNDKYTFISFGYKNSTNKYTVNYQCENCHQEITKDFESVLKNPSCPYCENGTLLNTEGFRIKIQDEFDLLSEYKKENEKVLVRHKKCGFIWPAVPRKLYKEYACPKCNRKRSRGERKILDFLNSKNISCYMEKVFSWAPNRRYDFFLPEYNLVIEYMGEQHYREVPFFEFSLEEQQKRDSEKKEAAIQNGLNYLSIGYFDFSNIEHILSKWLNDYPKGIDSSESKEK